MKIGRFCIWMAAGIIANTLISTNSLAHSVEPKPVLVFRIVNSAHVPGEVLAHAGDHVENIFGKSGIRVQWLTGNNTPATMNSTWRIQLTILLVPEDMALRLGRPDHETGFAISSNGKGARCAYVFVGRARNQADMAARLGLLTDAQADGLILGYVIAHEAGHLMLPPGSHTITGIMRAKMDMASIELALQGRLIFQPEQTQFMQTALMTQSAQSQ
jgi:hypothetical protein